MNVRGLGAGIWWRGGWGGCGQHHFWVVSSSTSPLGLLLAPMSLGAWSDLNVWGYLSHQQRPLRASSDLIKPRVCCQLGEASCPLASSFLRACAQCGAALRISFQGGVGHSSPGILDCVPYWPLGLPGLALEASGHLLLMFSLLVVLWLSGPAERPTLSVLQFSHQEIRKLRWDERYREPICPMMWPVLCLTCPTPRVSCPGKPGSVGWHLRGQWREWDCGAVLESWQSSWVLSFGPKLEL